MTSNTQPTGLVRWRFGNWAEQPTAATQLQTLNRHITEVNNYVFDAQQNGRRVMLQPGYQASLMNERRQLQAQVALSASEGSPLTSRFGIRRFNRGSSS